MTNRAAALSAIPSGECFVPELPAPPPHSAKAVKPPPTTRSRRKPQPSLCNHPTRPAVTVKFHDGRGNLASTAHARRGRAYRTDKQRRTPARHSVLSQLVLCTTSGALFDRP
jgi:hypothetical protein